MSIVSRMTNDIKPMTPIEASLLTASLLDAMDKLSTLDLHPVQNSADIEHMRAVAESMARDVLGYLLTSENFAPVVEQDDAVQEWDL